MATLVVEGDIDVDVGDYGATHDKERVVPSGITMDYPRSRPPSWKTKKAAVVLVGLLGMTAAVASSTVLFYSILDVSKPASTGPMFLLHASGGTDNKCVVASGPWPHSNPNLNQLDFDIHDDDDNPSGNAYTTCFGHNKGYYGYQDMCWSKSYKDGWGNWQPCKPKGFGSSWEFALPSNQNTWTDTTTPETCGKPCTEFAS